MNEILLTALIVFAVLATSFTEQLFRHGWPLLERAVRQRLQPDDDEMRRELQLLRERLQKLESRDAA